MDLGSSREAELPCLSVTQLLPHHRIATGYNQRRVNMTLLFGDRWSPVAAKRGIECVESAASQSSQSAVTADAAGAWDLFD